MSRALVVRAPTRLDFGGGWTDVPPYSEEEGGVVCNIAITRYATVTAAIGGHPASRTSTSTTGDHRLIRAALERSGLTGADASVSNDFPVGAGLGGSSAAGVALAGALALLAGEPAEPGMIAERSRATEVDGLGIAGGFQDHYAAAFGGALLLTFEGSVAIEQIGLTPSICRSLSDRALLVYTGESRMSGATIDAVLDAYRAREPRVCGALARMKSLARVMAAAVRAGDVDALGRLVGEHWVHQRSLHPTITTARIDAIMDVSARHGGIGGKALGASGGGCVLVFAAQDRADDLAAALEPLGERLRYDIDERGFDVLATLSGEADA
jgi:D-glycero-alpha-D-manno-heptose-7-phosphate kinase